MSSKMPKSVIEVSSEAARKIGGIYTVIRSKTRELHKKFGNEYLLIGFLDEKCNDEVRFEEPEGKLRDIFFELEREGIICKCGKWTYGNNVRVICVDAKQAGERIGEYYFENGKKGDKQSNYYKYLLWKHFGIDSIMETSWDFTENIVWGFGVGMLLEKLFEKGLFSQNQTVVHFHEWISGSALLYCKMKKLGAGTLFTTHATVLGRTLASSGVDVYSQALAAQEPISINVAYERKVEGKHQVEAAAARECDIFTTVSETVAAEVKYILGREADVITVNGIEFRKGAVGKDEQDMSTYIRSEVKQFIEACFVSYYPQRYDESLLVFSSGRYEFLNKGFDVYIKALGMLNERLKKKAGPNAKRVFAFIFAPSSVQGPKISIIKNYLLLDKIGEVLEQLPETRDLTYVNFQHSLKHLNGSAKRDLENMAKGFLKEGGRPPINCYELNYKDDSIINACNAAGLTNSEEDIVKVLFYPTYIKPNDGLMNMGYYDVISAMDVGVFPSRYEPFGYTPVEAASKLNIAITSDMTGFGRFIMEKIANEKSCGVKVIGMAQRSLDDSSNELATELEAIYHLSPRELFKKKKMAYNVMKNLDWSFLVKNYYRAFSLAIEKRRGMEDCGEHEKGRVHAAPVMTGHAKARVPKLGKAGARKVGKARIRAGKVKKAKPKSSGKLTGKSTRRIVKKVKKVKKGKRP